MTDLGEGRVELVRLTYTARFEADIVKVREGDQFRGLESIEKDEIAHRSAQPELDPNNNPNGLQTPPPFPFPPDPAISSEVKNSVKNATQLFVNE